MLELPRLMLVTDRKRIGGRDLADRVSRAVAGGAGIVQVREKDLDDGELESLVERIRKVVTGEPVLLVNGREEVARTAACGLHLPASASLRSREGISLLGRSVHDAVEIRRALEDDPDYLVLGTVFPTASKPGRETLGLQRLASLVRLAGKVPVYGIGGIHRGNAAGVIRAGCHGVAVVGALLTAMDPEREASILHDGLG